jgi:predicted CopG family antitoxin
MVGNTKTIEISQELYDAIQQLKQIFSQLTNQKIEKDEDVI